MRHFINIVENFDPSEYLRGIFYHGSAYDPRPFHANYPAYFTQNIKEATMYANMDAEIEGGKPIVYKVKLHCTKPAILDLFLMQDLAQTQVGRDTYKELVAQGYDCALGNNGGDEICVFGSSKIEVLDIIKIDHENYNS